MLAVAKINLKFFASQCFEVFCNVCASQEAGPNLGEKRIGANANWHLLVLSPIQLETFADEIGC